MYSSQKPAFTCKLFLSLAITFLLLICAVQVVVLVGKNKFALLYADINGDVRVLVQKDLYQYGCGYVNIYAGVLLPKVFSTIRRVFFDNSYIL